MIIVGTMSSPWCPRGQGSSRRVPPTRTHPVRDPSLCWFSSRFRRGLAKCARLTRSERPPLADSGYFIIEANSDLGWKNFDSGLVEAVVGTGNGCGMTMIGALGGPRPLPSCATATVVTDIMSKSVTIVYFILILLERGGSTRRRRRAYAICRQHRRISFRE